MGRRKKEKAEEVVESVETGNTVKETAEEKAEEVVESVWKVLPLQSDKEVIVEGCSIETFQKRGTLLRYRVNGKLTEKITFVEGFLVKLYRDNISNKQIWQLR